MRADSAMVRCRKCGVINRIPVEKIGLQPRCGKCKAILDIPRKPIAVSSADFSKEVLSWPGLVLVDFWAPWCAHCQSVKMALAELARERVGEIKVVEVNTENAPELIGRFDIRGIPTLMLFKSGTKLDEIPGAIQKQQIEKWLDSFSGGNS